VFQKSAKKQAKYKATYLYRVKSTCFYPNPLQIPLHRQAAIKAKDIMMKMILILQLQNSPRQSDLTQTMSMLTLPVAMFTRSWSNQMKQSGITKKFSACTPKTGMQKKA